MAVDGVKKRRRAGTVDHCDYLKVYFHLFCSVNIMLFWNEQYWIREAVVLLPPTYKVRGKIMFSVCQSTGGGILQPLIPGPFQGWGVLSQVLLGVEYPQQGLSPPPYPSGQDGYSPSQDKGTPHPLYERADDATPRAVRLLWSRRRTFLLLVNKHPLFSFLGKEKNVKPEKSRSSCQHVEYF